MKTMTSYKNVVFLIVALILAVFAFSNVSASVSSSFGTITSVEVNGIESLGGVNVAAFAGSTLSVRTIFDASVTAEDVRVKAWISGGRDYSAASERFDVI